MNFKFTLVWLTLITLCACGGGGSDSTVTVVETPSPTVFTGIFVDSAVIGLNYQTTSQSGSTSAQGEFLYQNGETITFSIGDIEFPEVVAKMQITPLDIFATDEIENIAVVNMLRLLQTLDVDGDATNGIEISEIAHSLATGIEIDFSADDFDQQVAEFIIAANAYYLSLISSQQALMHFEASLGLNISTCSSSHNKVGYSGTFQTLAHNVAGTATILDDCTIEITHFDYDGGGPEVYVYAGIDHDYDSAQAFAISQKINGSAYQNDTLTLRLPQGRTLDDLNGISVWCVDFSADFGHLDFIAP